MQRIGDKCKPIMIFVLTELNPIREIGIIQIMIKMFTNNKSIHILIIIINESSKRYCRNNEVNLVVRKTPINKWYFPEM